MTNTYNCIYRITSTFFIIVFLVVFVQFANAQTLYRTVSASQIDIAASPIVQSITEIKSEGSYLIKDGGLDEIYNLKFILPTSLLNTLPKGNLISNKKITFEQTHVMVLPIMGMVHFVGILDVDGVRNATSFQLGFLVNNDQSITFKGIKSFKLNDFAKDLPNDELKLNIDFVLRNSKTDLTILTSK